jgi:glucose/arabinose dehydrogenase
MFRRTLNWLRKGRPADPGRVRHARPGAEALEDRTVPHAVLPAGFQDSTVARGFAMPTCMEFAPDGRLFVAEQTGDIKVVQNGVPLPTPFLHLDVTTYRERGIDGFTFDPHFETNGYVYVFYNRGDAPTLNRVSRFRVSATDPNVADPGSEMVVLDGLLSQTGYHNGGALHFGADGMLYVGVGDSGIKQLAQKLGSLNGKILRLDPSGTDVVPPDNPFVKRRGARKEIFAYGFRNPFTFAAVPGSPALLVNDVGDARWEEVDLVLPGRNYGWGRFEGPMGRRAGFTNPLLAYRHTLVNGIPAACVVGGAFATGALGPVPAGAYFFADFVHGWLKYWNPKTPGQMVPFATGLDGAVDLDVGPDGGLYYLSLNGGEVHEISYVGGSNRPPELSAAADRTNGDGPLAVNFTAAGTDDPDGDPLTYTWDFGDGSAKAAGATAAHVYTANGVYQATLTVQDTAGHVVTSTPIAVTVGNNAPVGTITLPADGAVFAPGSTVSFAGAGTDAEDGVLPDSAFSWSVTLQHNTHFHPFLSGLVGRSGSFVIPKDVKSHGPGVWFRLHLYLTDSGGLTSETTRDIFFS